MVINKKLNQIIAMAVLALSGMVFIAVDAHADEGLSMMDVIALKAKADDPKQSFAIADEDGDGRVTRAEYRLRKTFIFDKMDVDRDGFLSRNEIPILKASVFDAADTDRDGKLSAVEFHLADFAKFDLFDENKDGAITFDELLSFRERMK
jgi:Ca2+-binding EF-hand superfamily protein